MATEEDWIPPWDCGEGGEDDQPTVEESFALANTSVKFQSLQEARGFLSHPIATSTQDDAAADSPGMVARLNSNSGATSLKNRGTEVAKESSIECLMEVDMVEKKGKDDMGEREKKKKKERANDKEHTEKDIDKEEKKHVDVNQVVFPTPVSIRKKKKDKNKHSDDSASNVTVASDGEEQDLNQDLLGSQKKKKKKKDKSKPLHDDESVCNDVTVVPDCDLLSSDQDLIPPTQISEDLLGSKRKKRKKNKNDPEKSDEQAQSAVGASPHKSDEQGQAGSDTAAVANDHTTARTIRGTKRKLLPLHPDIYDSPLSSDVASVADDVTGGKRQKKNKSKAEEGQQGMPPPFSQASNDERENPPPPMVTIPDANGVLKTLKISLQTTNDDQQSSQKEGDSQGDESSDEGCDGESTSQGEGRPKDRRDGEEDTNQQTPSDKGMKHQRESVTKESRRKKSVSSSAAVGGKREGVMPYYRPGSPNSDFEDSSEDDKDAAKNANEEKIKKTLTFTPSDDEYFDSDNSDDLGPPDDPLPSSSPTTKRQENESNGGSLDHEAKTSDPRPKKEKDSGNNLEPSNPNPNVSPERREKSSNGSAAAAVARLPLPPKSPSAKSRSTKNPKKSLLRPDEYRVENYITQLDVRHSLFDCRLSDGDDSSTLADRWKALSQRQSVQFELGMSETYGPIVWELDPLLTPQQRKTRKPLVARPMLKEMVQYIQQHEFPLPPLNQAWGGQLKTLNAKRMNELELTRLAPDVRSGRFDREEEAALADNLKRFFVCDLKIRQAATCMELVRELLEADKANRHVHARLYFAAFVAGPQILAKRVAYDVFLCLFRLLRWCPPDVAAASTPSRQRRQPEQDWKKKWEEEGHSLKRYTAQDSVQLLELLFKANIPQNGQDLANLYFLDFSLVDEAVWDKIADQLLKPKDSLKKHVTQRIEPVLLKHVKGLDMLDMDDWKIELLDLILENPRYEHVEQVNMKKMKKEFFTDCTTQQLSRFVFDIWHHRPEPHYSFRMAIQYRRDRMLALKEATGSPNGGGGLVQANKANFRQQQRSYSGEAKQSYKWRSVLIDKYEELKLRVERAPAAAAAIAEAMKNVKSCRGAKH